MRYASYLSMDTDLFMGMRYLLILFIVVCTALADVVPTIATLGTNQVLVLSVQSSGTSLTYQWYKDGKPLSGQVSEDLGVSLTSFTSTGTYYCVVKNAIGSITSTEVKVSVISTTKTPSISVTSFVPTTPTKKTQ